MKRLYLLTWLLAASLLTVGARKKQTVQQLWPDGTPVSQWFCDTAKVDVTAFGKQYVITDYGVSMDSTMIQTSAIQQVIDRCAEEGGGVVVVPRGTFHTGALFFKKGTHLHFEDGGKLKGIDDIRHYPLIGDVLAEGLTGTTKFSAFEVSTWTQFHLLEDRPNMPVSNVNNVSIRNVKAKASRLFSVKQKHPFTMSHFTFENIEGEDQYNSFDIDQIDGVTVKNVRLNGNQQGHYLFAYFNNNTTEGQQICYAVSDNGLDFTPLNGGRPVISPKKISLSGGVRDPHLLRADDGWFYQVATDMDMSKGKWTCRGIVMMRSRDLIHWQHHTVHFPKRYRGKSYAEVNAVWAPQTIYDPAVGKYMVYFSLHSEKDGPYPKDAIYYAYANEDFSDLENDPQPLFSYPNPTIDTDIVRDEQGVYHLFFNTWGGPEGLLRRQYVFTDLHRPESWTLLEGDMQPTLPGKERIKSEGSTAYQLSDGSWILSYDCFADGVYHFCKTTDLQHFEQVRETPMTGTFTPRHGSVLRITDEEYQRLKSYYR